MNDNESERSIFSSAQEDQNLFTLKPAPMVHELGETIRVHREKLKKEELQQHQQIEHQLEEKLLHQVQEELNAFHRHQQDGASSSSSSPPYPSSQHHDQSASWGRLLDSSSATASESSLLKLKYPAPEPHQQHKHSMSKNQSLSMLHQTSQGFIGIAVPQTKLVLVPESRLIPFVSTARPHFNSSRGAEFTTVATTFNTISGLWFDSID